MSNSPAVTGKSLYIYTYTAISCSDMKARGNCRQGGFYVQKWWLPRFSTSRKRYLKCTNRQNKKNLFILALIQVPLAHFHPSQRIGYGWYFPKLFPLYVMLESRGLHHWLALACPVSERCYTCLGANVSPGQHMHIKYP